MGESIMRFSTPALLAFALVATVPTAPAAAAGPSISIQNVESRSSVNGCSDFRFDADIIAKSWPAGMAHTVKYRWERAGYNWPLRTITIPASGKMHTHATHTPRKGTTGFAWVHVTSPVNVVSPRVGYSNSNC